MTTLQQLKPIVAALLCLAVALFTQTTCQSDVPEDPAYAESVSEWHSNRLQRLTRPVGWTTLVGLQWLRDGISGFGSCDSCDIRLPEKAPKYLGRWKLHGDTVTLTPAGDIMLTMNDSAFTGGIVKTDQENGADLMNWHSLYWSVIYRGGRYAVRIWDTLSHDRYRVDSIPRYATDISYAVRVEVHPPYAQDSVVVDNALGFTQHLPVAGYVEGRVHDTEFRLTALDGGPEKLFIIFSDLTTDIETYSGGRYAYIARPDADGHSVLDFNLAYNPPCVFTEFATCLLPPKDNFIVAYVRAGEKNFSLHH